MQEKLEAYTALYNTVCANKQHIEENHFHSIREKLLEIEKSVEFNMNLERHCDTWYKKYMCYGNEACVGLFGSEYNRTISWSDDGKQPEGEWLCNIRFHSGAYIFGDAISDKYPKETFNAFFQELKAFGVKYCDTANNSLYFSSDIAYKVVEAFPIIFKKYKDMCQQEYERQRVKELEAELAKLRENK